MRGTGFQKWSPEWSFYENVSLPLLVIDRNRGFQTQWCHALYSAYPVRPCISIVLAFSSGVVENNNTQHMDVYFFINGNKSICFQKNAVMCGGGPNHQCAV